MVPEALGGQRGRIGGQEAGQDGLPVPVGELQFAGGETARLMAASSRYWPGERP